MNACYLVAQILLVCILITCVYCHKNDKLADNRLYEVPESNDNFEVQQTDILSK